MNEESLFKEVLDLEEEKEIPMETLSESSDANRQQPLEQTLIIDKQLIATSNSKAGIRKRNEGQPRAHLSKISKYLHALLFEWLEPRKIFEISGVCRTLNKSTKQSGVWEAHFPDPA